MLPIKQKFSLKPFHLLLATLLHSLSSPVVAQSTTSSVSLKSIKVPETPGLLGKSGIVVNTQAAIQLGKSLFWDMNVGSDGVACASCHFHAGSDRRTVNQLNTGQLHQTDALSAKTFDLTPTDTGGPNYPLKLSDFPLFRFENPEDKTTLSFSTDDVVGSSGVSLRQFQGVVEANDHLDNCTSQLSDIFHNQGLNTRQTTKRNAPSVINTGFNYRNFWDGRANNIFNGQSTFGFRDSSAKIWVAAKPQDVRQISLSLANASLASQAVSPPQDMIEMSCQGRLFPEIGKKLLSRRPLEAQQIHPEDSVLATLRDATGYGLATTYAELIKKAFAKQYWQGLGEFGRSSHGEPYSHLEANFALFFGLAIQLYENTLVSDDAPVDAALDSDGFPTGLNAQQKRGMNIFNNAHCSNCHSGPTFSAAANPQIYGSTKSYKFIDRTVLTEQGDGFGVDRTLFDIGFADTSVTPNDYDIGLGGMDPFGNPLSFVDQYLLVLQKKASKMIDPVSIAACYLTDPFVEDYFSNELTADSVSCKGSAGASSRIPLPSVVTAELAKAGHGRMSTAVKGAFKIPSLRNVELTGPYMHNGGMKSLEEVIEFYNRGGNVNNPRHFSTLVFPQGFSEQEKADLIAFLKALTDERVRWEKAPFDHPELWVPHGHLSGEDSLVNGMLQDNYLLIPPIGKNGRSTDQGPLKPFDNYLQP